MKKIGWLLRAIGLLLLFLLVGVGSLAYWTFAGSSTAIDGELQPGIEVICDSFACAYLLAAEHDKYVLIDSGQDEHAEKILAVLKKKGSGPEAVQAILLTHGHGDHIGGAKIFKQATLYALQEELDLVEGRVAAGSPLGQMLGVLPTGLQATALHDGLPLTVGQLTFNVYAVPGHTAGSAAYLVQGVLFLGDSADASSKGFLRPAKWVFSDDQSQNVASLQRLAQRLEQERVDVKTLAFAHSGPLQGLEPLLRFAHK